MNAGARELDYAGHVRHRCLALAWGTHHIVGSRMQQSSSSSEATPHPGLTTKADVDTRRSASARRVGGSASFPNAVQASKQERERSPFNPTNDPKASSHQQGGMGGPRRPLPDGRKEGRSPLSEIISYLCFSVDHLSKTFTPLKMPNTGA